MDKIVSDIIGNKLFGAVEVDIEVKDEFEDFFSEYPPFFCTCDVPMQAIGDHMTKYCQDNDIKFTHKRLLISGLKARKILLATPLLQWYLKNECVITKIYQVIEFQPKFSFKSFIDKVTQHRIEGDQNPDKAIIGDAYKLISNSSYGSILMDRTRHCNVKYLTNRIKVSKIIISSKFKSMEELGAVFEVEIFKSRITIDNPIQIGFFILQYAKLRMLEFYYDCLIKYMKPNSFELTETDTDSIYMAINAESLDDCIKSDYKSRYEKEIFGSCSDNKNPVWFPRRCCSKHSALDSRFCGAYKLEFQGIKMVSLCSKSYIIEDADGRQKIYCKGISKKNLSNPMSNYEETLKRKCTRSSTNHGFRMNGSDMFTYSQEKIGFNYFYCKREVLSDGISTKPLPIILSPWNTDVEVINQVQDPLSNLFSCILIINNLFFHSLEQLFDFLFAKHYNKDEISNAIDQCNDPLEIHPIALDLINKKPNLSETEDIMRKCFQIKYNQSLEFQNRLQEVRNKLLYYKQSNFTKNESSYWGVTNSSKMLNVLDQESVAENNIVGHIIMDFSTQSDCTQIK